MRRIPIRIKLAAALAVPLVAMTVVTLLEVASVSRDAREVRQQTNLASATIGPNGLITALQNERNWAAAYLVGVHEQVALVVVGFDETRAEADDALTQFRAEIERRGEAAETVYDPALRGLEDDLGALRAEIDDAVAAAGDQPLTVLNMPAATGFFDRYTGLIEPFFGGMTQISVAMDDPVLRQGASLMETVTRQIETVPQLTNRLILPSVAATVEGDDAGINRPAEIAEVAELQDVFRRQADELRAASGPYAAVADEYYPEEFTQILDGLADEGIANSTIDLDRLVTDLDVGSLDQAYIGYQDAVAAALQSRADDLNDSASSRQLRFELLMVVTLGAAIVLTVLVSLSITRPLRSLTRQAKDMAEHRLPEAVAEILDTPLGDDVVVPMVAPVRVATRDEVADVASALNTVQDSALDLAVEQAVLRRNIADSFVNLGRRNQNLLGRQLDFVTELESNETDPDTLSSLFRLDHLATRMRRNAESLLVLAGIEPPRQWAAPVRLGDVIRAALGEVENYQRVTIRSVEPATIVGSAAADLAHLLAELIENALVFSPPDQTVEIRGRRRPGADVPAGYTLAVIDSGLGMPAQDIEAANRRLAGVESFTVAPSKYLGHYVAGNLAARHGIGVQLRTSPGTGITATVEVPPDLLTVHAEPAPAPAPPRRGTRALAGPPPRAAVAPPTPAPSPATIGPGPAFDAGRGVGPDPRSGPGRAPTPDAPAARTAAGLVRRMPPAGGSGTRTPGRAPAGPTDDQLASLARFTGRGSQPDTRPVLPPSAHPVPATPGASAPTWGGPPAAPPAPPAPAVPAARPPAGTAPPLTRRQRGAQLPTTAPVRLHGGSGAGPERAEGGAAGAGPAAGGAAGAGPAAAAGVARPTPPRAATEVYDFLSSFSAGVQRGLDATRHRGGEYEPRP